MEEQIIIELEKAIISGDTETFLSVFSKEATISKLQSPLSEPIRKTQGIAEHLIQNSGNIEISEAKSDVQKKWLEQFGNIEHAQLDIHDIISINEDTLSLRIYLDIRGEDTNKNLRQDRGWISMDCQTDLNKYWKVSNFSFQKRSTDRHADHFFDVTKEVCESSVPLSQPLEALRRGGVP